VPTFALSIRLVDEPHGDVPAPDVAELFAAQDSRQAAEHAARRLIETLRAVAARPDEAAVLA